MGGDSVRGGWVVGGSFRAYYLASYLTGLMISVYYTYTRAVIGGLDYGGKYALVVFLAAMESIPGLLSVIFGFVSDVAGRRNALLAGLVSSLILVAMGFVEPRLYPIMAFGVFTGYTFFWASLYGVILDYVEGRGKPLSLFGLAGSLGWSSGGVITGLISNYGPQAVFMFAGLSIGLASVISYATFPQGLAVREKPKLDSLVRGIRSVIVIFIAYLLGSAGVSIYINSMGLRLFEVLGGDMLVYGFLFSTMTGLLGAISRPFAGMLVDKMRPEVVLAGVFATYLFSGIMVTLHIPLFLMILVWLLPLYPFYETSALTTSSRRLPANLQSTAAGIVGTGSSLSGFVNAIASSVIGEGGFQKALLIGVLLLSVSLLLLVFVLTGEGKRNKGENVMGNTRPLQPV